MMRKLSDEKFLPFESVRESDMVEHALANFRLESAAWNSVRATVSEAEVVTLDHIFRLKKLNKLSRKLAREGKRLEREQVSWAELDIKR